MGGHAITRMKRVIVHCMSGFVVLIGLLLMVVVMGAMSGGQAAWDITAVVGTGVALLVLAGTVIWRTTSTHMAWWEVAEAAIQYAFSGGLLAWSMLNHGFYDVSVAYSQAHLIISALFCAWNLLRVYWDEREPDAAGPEH